MKNPWYYLRKIASLPKARRTPEVSLAQTLEKANAGKIKSVYIGIEWSDGTFCGDWSNMTLQTLAFHAAIADKVSKEQMTEGGDLAL